MLKYFLATTVVKRDAGSSDISSNKLPSFSSSSSEVPVAVQKQKPSISSSSSSSSSGQMVKQISVSELINIENILAISNLFFSNLKRLKKLQSPASQALVLDRRPPVHRHK